MTGTPFWDRQKHADRAPLLRTRGRIKTALRGYFEGQGFIEAECGILAVSPGNETHLHAFGPVRGGTASGDLYLHTSPEFAAKKLLAAGETRIFDFARVFRARERGPLHAPEFTMLEWYRAHQGWDAAMDDCAHLLSLAARAAGTRMLAWRGRVCDPFAAPERVTVHEAFERHLGIDLAATMNADGAHDRDHLATRARRAGADAAENDSWSDIFSKLVARIETRLGLGAATLLTHYPASESALARPCAGDARFAERFELYACGVELANGFGELTDPILQRARLQSQMDSRAAIHGEHARYPLDEDFLAALAHMPPASGVALGFDRLVMLAAGAPHIDHVLWTPLPDGQGA